MAKFKTVVFIVLATLIHVHPATADPLAGEGASTTEAGAAIIAATYLPSIVAAATSSEGADRWLYVPVVGPWVDLGKRNCSQTGGTCAVLVGDGLLQGAGVLMTLLGIELSSSGSKVTASISSPASASAAENKTSPATTIRISGAQLGAGGGFAVSGAF